MSATQQKMWYVDTQLVVETTDMQKKKKLFGEKGNHPFTCLYYCFADNMGLVNDVINKKKVLTTKNIFVDLNFMSLSTFGVSILTTLSFRKYVSFD